MHKKLFWYDSGIVLRSENGPYLLEMHTKILTNNNMNSGICFKIIWRSGIFTKKLA